MWGAASKLTVWCQELSAGKCTSGGPSRERRGADFIAKSRIVGCDLSSKGAEARSKLGHTLSTRDLYYVSCTYRRHFSTPIEAVSEQDLKKRPGRMHFHGMPSRREGERTADALSKTKVDD